MIRFIFCASILIILLSQCSPVYVPNTRNTPLFAQAGEFQGTMQVGTSGIDLQGAVSITNNIAVMGNYSYGNRNTDTLNNNSNDLDNYHKHKFYEGGIGYYKNEDQFCFEVFVGYGQGEATSYGDYSIFSSQKELTTGKYNRIFLQPSFGLNKKVVHVAFTPRFSWVDFTDFTSSKSNLNVDVEPKIFIEPAVTAKFNFLDNRFFGTIQAGVSTTLADNVYFDYEHFNISTGLGFRLGGIRWSKAKSSDTQQ